MRSARLNVLARLEATTPGRVAVVGCGLMGRQVARAVALLPGWRVTALYDSRPDAARALGSTLTDAPRLASALDDLFQTLDYDVVAIATTAPSHVPIALRAIDAGVRRILLEKPVSCCLAQADALTDRAAAAGVVVSVDHTRRWVAPGDGLARLLRSGAIGSPQVCHIVHGRAGLSMIGTHFIDFARWVFGADVSRVRAELDGVFRPSHRGLEFIDPSGRLEAALTNRVRLTVDLSDSIPVNQGFVLLIGEHGRIEVDERLGRVRLIGAGRRVWESEYVWPGAAVHGVAAALLELRSASITRCTLRDGTAALEAVVAGHLSARSGGSWVDLPLSGAARAEEFPFA